MGLLIIGLVEAGAVGQVWPQGTRGPMAGGTPRLMRGTYPAPPPKGVHPPEAYDLSIWGHAVVRCRIDKTRLRTCEAVSETPVGMGFGAAGARSLERQRLNRWGMDGRADGEMVEIALDMRPKLISVRPPIEWADWEQGPTFEQVEAAWPAAAGNLATGSAALRCTVDGKGALQACAVAGEEPRRSAFGEAALTLAPAFRVNIDADDGTPVPTYDVLVSFRFHNPSLPAGRTRQIDKPDWVRSPNKQQIMAVFPPEATAAGVKAGVGVVVCRVAAQGALVDCAASQEAPEGLGFGRSAIAVVRSMQLVPWTREGRPVVGGQIKIAVRFPPTPKFAPKKSKTPDGDAD